MEILSYLNENRKTFLDLSDEIWGLAELSMQEYRSAEAYLRCLEDLGFKVENHLAGLPTAFLGLLSWVISHLLFLILGKKSNVDCFRGEMWYNRGYHRRPDALRTAT